MSILIVDAVSVYFMKGLCVNSGVNKAAVVTSWRNFDKMILTIKVGLGPNL